MASPVYHHNTFSVALYKQVQVFNCNNKISVIVMAGNDSITFWGLIKLTDLDAMETQPVTWKQ